MLLGLKFVCGVKLLILITSKLKYGSEQVLLQKNFGAVTFQLLQISITSQQDSNLKVKE